MSVVRTLESPVRLWPEVEELVPPDLPADVAVARLIALVRSLLIENRQLHEVLEATAAPDSPLEAA